MSVESIGSAATAVQSTLASSPNIERQEKAERISQNVQSEIQVANVKEVDKAELQNAVQKLNDFTSNNTQRSLSFSLDEDSQEMVVTVRDAETLEVIKQMPTKEALAVAKQIESMLGLILNDKA